jgi:hypothetical protein
MKTLLKFSSAHAKAYNYLNQERHLVTRPVYKQRRSIALMEWRALQGKASLASGRVALRVGGCG